MTFIPFIKPHWTGRAWRVVVHVPEPDPVAAAEIVASSSYFKPVREESK